MTRTNLFGETTLLSKRESDYFDLLSGIEFNIPICCTIFFECCYAIRMDIPEYWNSMIKLTRNTGIVLCPKCLIKQVKKNSHKG